MTVKRYKLVIMDGDTMTKRTRSSGDGTIVELPGNRYKAILRWTNLSGKEVSKTQICSSLRAANLAIAKFKKIRDSGQDPRAKSKTVGDLLDSWLAFKATEVTPGTIDQYQYAAKHIKAGLGSMALDKLQPEIIDKFLKSKTDEGLSPRYVKLLRTVLSMSLDQAIRWKLVDSNPAKFSASIKQPQRQSRALSETEAKALLTGARDDRLGALWTLLLTLGLRRGEALALTWSDYDRKAKTLSITKNRKKEGSKVVVGSLKTEASRRTLPLPQFICQALDNHRANQLKEKEYLLSLGVQWKEPNAMFATVWGHYLDPDNTSKLFKSVARKAGLEGWHLHELRHSAATFLITNGTPLEQVSKLLGHSSIRITSDVYSHLAVEHLRGATDAIGTYLQSLKN